MSAPRFKFNKKAYDNGLDLNLHVDFIPTNDGEMELLICSISKGYDCIDYAFVANDRTLVDVIKEFISHE